MNIVPPGEWLGVMGGGQLAKMFCMAAQQLGYKTMVWDPNPYAPAHAVCNSHLVSGFEDQNSLKKIQECSAVTVEFENIPIYVLEDIAKFTRLTPSAHAVAIAQDRLKEKKFLQKIGARVVPYLEYFNGIWFTSEQKQININEQKLLEFLPGILKTATSGYDGKGQVSIADKISLEMLINKDSSGKFILEKCVDLKVEFSVILCRNSDGKIITYPIQENKHKSGVLFLTIVPALQVPDDVAQFAIQLSKRIARDLNYVGVLCVEFFIDRSGILFVNEIAPRPHNSGHYSIEACETSQFEQQVRIMSGLPLGNTFQHSHAAMVNLLGDLWYQDTEKKKKLLFSSKNNNFYSPEWETILAISGTHLHLYGKTQAHLGRKMGHITLTSRDHSKLLQGIHEIESALGL